MSEKEHAFQAVSTIQQTLQKALGNQLIALYLFGSLAQKNFRPGLSDINLIAVVKDWTSIHEIRGLLQPVWHQFGTVLKKNPAVATPQAFHRHLKLNPYLANHLTQNGRLLAGQAITINPLPLSPAEQIAILATASQQASASLAPTLLLDNEAETTFTKLQRLALCLEKKEFEFPGLAVDYFAAIQTHLSRELSKYPHLQWQGKIPTDPPPLIDTLQAIYEKEDQVIFLLPDWPAEEVQRQIHQIDWPAVAKSLKDQYYGLQVTTPTQLRLSLHYDRAASHYLKNYQHIWGQNPLESLEIPHWQVSRDLARFASRIEIDSFPHAYITSDDDQLSILIHDFQNKLLNIQLREELMCRFDSRPKATPPTPLPDRSTPPIQRIEAIYEHLDWWAGHYTAVMEQEQANS